MGYPNGEEVRRILAQAPTKEQLDRAIRESLRAPTAEQIHRALQRKIPTSEQLNRTLRSRIPTTEELDVVLRQSLRAPTPEQLDRIFKQATQGPTAEQLDRILKQATQGPTAEQLDRILKQEIRLPSADQIAESLKNATRIPSTQQLNEALGSVFSATKLAELAKHGLADDAAHADYSLLGQPLKTPDEEWFDALDEAFPVDESNPEHYEELFQTLVEQYDAQTDIQRAKRSLRDRAPWLTEDRIETAVRKTFVLYYIVSGVVLAAGAFAGPVAGAMTGTAMAAEYWKWDQVVTQWLNNLLDLGSDNDGPDDGDETIEPEDAGPRDGN
jgi:hypothetical protein